MNSLCFKICWLGCESRLVHSPWRPVTRTPGSQGTCRKLGWFVRAFIQCPQSRPTHGVCRPPRLSPSLSPLRSFPLSGPSAQGWEELQSCSHRGKALSTLSIFHPHPVRQQEASVKLNDNFLQKWCLNAHFQCIIMAREPLRAWGKDVKEMEFPGMPPPRTITVETGTVPVDARDSCSQGCFLLFSRVSKSA